MPLDLKKPSIIGVVHLKPLPGSPGYAEDGTGVGAICEAAVRDAKAYADGGASALIIENFGDVPFTRGRVEAETVASMAVVAARISDEVSLPMGFNVLRNDALSALGLCAAIKGGFIRVNVHTGAMIADQGLIQGEAYETLRKRQALVPEVKILADVHVKHAVPLGDAQLQCSAKDTVQRGLADALIASGSGTGERTDVRDLIQIREACPDTPLLVGSGASLENAAELMCHATGLIVGTSVKKDGVLGNAVDRDRVKRLTDLVLG